MNKKSFMKDALILCIITLFSGLLLGFFYELTKKPIEIANEEALNKAYKTVLSDFDTYDDVTLDILGASAGYNATLKFAYKVYDINKNYIGAIVETECQGFGGKVKIIVGFDTDKKITGIAFPEILSETPGLGMKITNEKFYSQYIGKTFDQFVLIKSGSEKLDNSIDAVTGATISSTACNDCINTACAFARRIQ